MNAQVKEINQIIAQCDVMIEYIKKNGIIRTGNAVYATYKERLKSFFDSHVEIKSKDYAPFAVLDYLYFNSTRDDYIQRIEALTGGTSYAHS